ncbi:hypothetical protein RhiirC2_802521 [Rhizophagus irregularis]|uniref:Uncharacterized protein n=1 Tax=Rhizophagus irregularis TaxID=588596 RepID=A0A2N1M170_9GLOM|nr:hypothetical protein RhiirC2_802521 [Rhizophagus irregularis]
MTTFRKFNIYFWEGSKLNAKAQSELEGRNILNENINLSKSRPAGKRFKAYDEGKNKVNSSKYQKENIYEIDIENMNDNSNNTSECRCGLCHKTGYYTVRPHTVTPHTVTPLYKNPILRNGFK